jgi:hypothetical protein
MTAGLWKLAHLEVSHSPFKRSGTLGGNLVTKDGDLECSEDALRRVMRIPYL